MTAKEHFLSTRQRYQPIALPQHFSDEEMARDWTLLEGDQHGVPGRVERTPAMFRSALCSLLAPAFRSRECHTIRPCTVLRLPLTEARLRDCRTSLFNGSFTARD